MTRRRNVMRRRRLCTAVIYHVADQGHVRRYTLLSISNTQFLHAFILQGLGTVGTVIRALSSNFTGAQMEVFQSPEHKLGGCTRCSRRRPGEAKLRVESWGLQASSKDFLLNCP